MVGHKKFQLAFIALTLANISIGLAAPSDDGYWNSVIETTAAELRTMAPPVTAHDFASTAAAATSSCYQTYARFYERDSIDIRVVFGYSDNRPGKHTNDLYMSQALIRHIQQPCSSHYEYCGFRPATHPYLFQKQVIGPNGRLKQVNLRIIHSSITGNDDLNRAQSEAQRKQSRIARAIFLQGLQQADAVFYMGHSRDGGGPDFDPPRLRADKHVDYPWYRRNRPGEKLMLQYLRATPKPPKLLALLSCYTDLHFVREVAQIHPEMSLIATNNEILFNDEFRAMLGTVNGLLGQWCKKSLQRAIAYPRGSGNPSLHKFFEPNGR